MDFLSQERKEEERRRSINMHGCLYNMLPPTSVSRPQIEPVASCPAPFKATNRIGLCLRLYLRTMPPVPMPLRPMPRNLLQSQSY